MTNMFLLKNNVLNYDWGMKDAFHELYGNAEKQNAPQAELWIGANYNNCSLIVSDGIEIRLDDYIKENKDETFNQECIFKTELPYLVKLLAAKSPLSIQVHPSKKNAEIGFLKEEENQIDINNYRRNYKDKNHKPELVYAITDFVALNGFKKFNEIAKLIKNINFHDIENVKNGFIENKDRSSLRKLFEELFDLDEDKIRKIIRSAIDYASDSDHEESGWLLYLNDIYPNDIGVIFPLFLNVVKLSHGQAMFLDAETLHAYISGIAIEVMANSDNVIRAGLTKKYIDRFSLIDNTKFEEKTKILTTPMVSGSNETYDVPVDDFTFSMLTVNESEVVEVKNATILFIVEGKVRIKNNRNALDMVKGESAFISYSARELEMHGNAKIAVISSK